jgi:hypothetical protein
MLTIQRLALSQCLSSLEVILTAFPSYCILILMFDMDKKFGNCYSVVNYLFLIFSSLKFDLLALSIFFIHKKCKIFVKIKTYILFSSDH